MRMGKLSLVFSLLSSWAFAYPQTASLRMQYLPELLGGYLRAEAEYYPDPHIAISPIGLWYPELEGSYGYGYGIRVNGYWLDSFQPKMGDLYASIGVVSRQEHWKHLGRYHDIESFLATGYRMAWETGIELAFGITATSRNELFRSHTDNYVLFESLFGWGF
ncbi:MAG: hypothetical protein JST16_16325 [Bdellovibrionales bacterium]|nr:hypothetical protein [Bdellovibrionales bacterium]